MAALTEKRKGFERKRKRARDDEYICFVSAVLLQGIVYVSEECKTERAKGREHMHLFVLALPFVWCPISARGHFCHFDRLPPFLHLTM